MRSGGQLRSTALIHERAIIVRTPRQIRASRKWARGIPTKAAAGKGAELGVFAIDKQVFVQSQKSGAKDRFFAWLEASEDIT
jgi:hypothetical protein